MKRTEDGAAVAPKALTAEGLERERYSGGADVLPCRDARRLLVVSSGSLPAQVEVALRAEGWELFYAADRPAALRVAQKTHLLVGLVDLPQHFDEARFREVREIVTSLNGLEWIAALGREQIRRTDVRRFVVQRLRDFQLLPLDPSRLTVVLGHACGLASLRYALRRQRDLSETRFGMIGSSQPMRDLYAMIERVSATDLPVLICGESGTGKELVARAIHAQSDRAAGPFLALNCAAIPVPLLQSELFGHEKGAFTDANERKTGLLEAATGGTLLLDEIGEMPPPAQSSLLRFLEDGRVTPVGGVQARRTDVRIVAATNRRLEQSIADGDFREDLFYRLAVVTLRTPPLRERDGDIDTLAWHFLKEGGQRAGKLIEDLDEEALAVLRRHNWPGNLRELRSWMLEAALNCHGGRITARDLGRVERTPIQSQPVLNEVLENTQRTALEDALVSSAWNVAQAAQSLGVSRMTLYRLLAKHGISRPSKSGQQSPRGLVIAE